MDRKENALATTVKITDDSFETDVLKASGPLTK